MTVYKDDRSATVISGGNVLVKFEGNTAEVSEDTAKILEHIGYRVEKGVTDNDTGGIVEASPPDSGGTGDTDTPRNGKKRN